uniref:hypothetical protein n=1 Tax=Polaribacter sp. TaxID=1920175 RepID=UPI0040475755
MNIFLCPKDTIKSLNELYSKNFIFVLMNIFNQPLLFKRISIVVSFVIVSLILWNTYTFFQKFKQEERIKMEILAEAQKELSTADLNSNIALSDKIITTNNSIPMILVDDKDEIIYANNLDSIKSLNPEYLQKQLAIIFNL